MFKLFKFLFRIDTNRIYSDTAVQPAATSNRVFLFHGTFDSELAATSYCFDAPGKNEPVPLIRDLPDAIIDLDEVEIIFGTDRIRAAIPMFTGNPSVLRDQIGDDNTLILFGNAAFCGMPYTLNDTPNLRYAGAFDVH